MALRKASLRGYGDDMGEEDIHSCARLDQRDDGGNDDEGRKLRPP